MTIEVSGLRAKVRSKRLGFGVLDFCLAFVLAFLAPFLGGVARREAVNRVLTFLR